jgi:hypothetical protein
MCPVKIDTTIDKRPGEPKPRVGAGAGRQPRGRRGDRQRRLGPIVLMLLVGVVGLSAGCGRGDSSSGPDPSAGTNVQGTSGPRASVVLKDVAVRLRAQVDAIASRYPGDQKPVTRDQDQPCVNSSSSHWPREWAYARALIITKSLDTRPIGEQIIKQLGAGGWAISRDPVIGQDVSVTARKDGFALSVNAGATTGRVNLVADSPCVTADGSLDRTARPVR